jgi:hypothetical protein
MTQKRLPKGISGWHIFDGFSQPARALPVDQLDQAESAEQGAARGADTIE